MRIDKGSATLFLTAITLFAGAASAQPRYPYVHTVFAGQQPLGDGGPASQAYLGAPVGLAVAPGGALYVTDQDTFRIRRILPNGNIETVAGSEGLRTPLQVSASLAGRPVFVFGQQIRTINEAGQVVVVAGDGQAGFADGPAAQARFSGPSGLAVCRFSGSEFTVIADTNNHRMRAIGLGLVSTGAGTGTAGFAGDGGPSQGSTLNAPTAVACDAQGTTIYIADNGNRRIRRVSNSRIATIAGNGNNGVPVNATRATDSPLGGIFALTVTPDGSVWAAERSRIIRITPEGALRVIAGAGFGNSGDGGPATQARFEFITAISSDLSGNVYVSDRDTFRVRKIDPVGNVSHFAGRSHFGGDGGPANRASFAWPRQITLDLSGNILIADERNHAIRKIDVASGLISTIAGTGERGFSGDGGPAARAQLHTPTDVKAARDGSIYIADLGNNRIRRIGPDGVIRTFAGTGAAGAEGDGGPAAQATLHVDELALDSQGNLYFSDTSSDRIRKISPSGIISAIAGDGTQGFQGDGGLATAAKMCNPQSMLALRDGSLLVEEPCNLRVRRIAPNGVISTYVGTGADGLAPDGTVISPSAAIGRAAGMSMDAAGNIFAARPNTAIIMIDTQNRLYRISNGLHFALARSAVVDAAGDVYVVDSQLRRRPQTRP